MASIPETERIKASESLELLQAAHGGRLATMAMLADLLRDGELRGYAERVWESDAPTVTRAWREVPLDTELQSDVPVEPKVWRFSKRWVPRPY